VSRRDVSDVTVGLFRAISTHLWYNLD